MQGIIDCIRKSGLEAAAIDELIHGSTIAINTLIERKGAKTGLVVTRGTRDVYIIGRGNRPEAYNLFFPSAPPAGVAPAHPRGGGAPARLGRGARAAAARSVAKPAGRLRPRKGVEAVAVCFLHSYANPEHERAAGEMIRTALPGAYLSLSHEILREYREFERMSTTVVNAYIGPKVGGYVKSLKSSLGDIGFRGDLSIMRSNGGVMTPEVATERPVAMMESGPVGGIIASARVGLALGLPERDLVRHGRHHREGEPGPRRRADARARLLRRRLRQRPSGDAADDRRGRGRRRRRHASPGSTTSAR